MNTINQEVDTLVEVIRSSDVYQNYKNAKEVLDRYPELKKKVDEYRTKNYNLQQNMSADIFEEAEKLQSQYLHELSDPIARQYLNAENSLCRVFQLINYKLLEELDFEIDLVEDK